MRSVQLLALLLAACAAADPSAQTRSAAAPGPSCDRTCLEGFVERYLEALVAHDPFGLPLANTVVFSENSHRLPVGDGLWNTATGLGEYRLTVSDPDAGQVGFFGTVRENGTLVALALRLAVVNRRITEIETLVVRDEAAAKAVDAMAPQPVFEEAVPLASRVTRPELIAVADRYFTAIDGGKAPFGPDCNRVQNGTQTTNNPTLSIPGMTWNPFSLGCQAQVDTTFFSFVDNVRPRRYAVVDRERGLVFGLFMFHVSGTVTSYTPPGRETMPALPQNLSPYTIAVAELYKIRNGQIGRIEALQVNVPYGTLSPFAPTDWRSPRRAVPVVAPRPPKPGPCDRACLEGFVTQYLEALVAHDPARLPVAPGVVFSENDVPLRLGEALWRTASGLGSYRLVFADPEAGQVGFMGTIRENGRPASLVLRLKIDAGRIAEAETLVLRNENTANNLEKAGTPDPILLETVAAHDRLPRRGARRHRQHLLRGDRTGQRRRGALRCRVQPVRERDSHLGRAGLLGAARHAHLRLHPDDPPAALHRGGRGTAGGVRQLHVQPPGRHHLGERAGPGTPRDDRPGEAAVRRGRGRGVPDQGPQDPEGRGADGQPAVRGDVAVRAPLGAAS